MSRDSDTQARVALFRSGQICGVGMVRDLSIEPLWRYSGASAPHRAFERFLEDWAKGDLDVTATGPALNLADATLLAPIPRSGKILCQVVNYAEHGEEASIAPPSRPFFFLRPYSSTIGAGACIQAHVGSSRVDYEAELAVMIRVPGRNIDVRNALRHAGALLVANDVSYRDLQFNLGHEDLNRRFGRNWTHGKGLDGSCALGPWLTLMSERDDFLESRTIETHVNGTPRQSAKTGQMIFGIEELISAASQGMTLHPGDVILTGTPAGVGLADGRYLNPGDTVTVAIEGLGQLENHVTGAS